MLLFCVIMEEDEDASKKQFSRYIKYNINAGERCLGTCSCCCTRASSCEKPKRKEVEPFQNVPCPEERLDSQKKAGFLRIRNGLLGARATFYESFFLIDQAKTKAWTML